MDGVAVFPVGERSRAGWRLAFLVASCLAHVLKGKLAVLSLLLVLNVAKDGEIPKTCGAINVRT